MEWKIKIANKNNRRLLIKYIPLRNKIEIYCQYKINNLWIDIYLREFSDENLNFDILKTEIYNIIVEFERKIDYFIKINQLFSNIDNIETDKLNDNDSDDNLNFDDNIY